MAKSLTLDNLLVIKDYIDDSINANKPEVATAQEVRDIMFAKSVALTEVSGEFTIPASTTIEGDVVIASSN